MKNHLLFFYLVFAIFTDLCLYKIRLSCLTSFVAVFQYLYKCFRVSRPLFVLFRAKNKKSSGCNRSCCYLLVAWQQEGPVLFSAVPFQKCRLLAHNKPVRSEPDGVKRHLQIYKMKHFNSLNGTIHWRQFYLDLEFWKHVARKLQLKKLIGIRSGKEWVCYGLHW